MTSSSGKVLARRLGDEVSFIAVGRVCASLCPALRQYAEDALSCGATAIEIDLADCTHCDSTFLGTLLALRQALHVHGPSALRLVHPSQPVRHIFSQMGADRLFQIVDHSPASLGDMTWEQLRDDSARAQSLRFKQTVVDAHQALASAGGELTERFAPLAEAMREELAAEQTPRP